MTGSIEDESIDAQPRVESRSRGPEVSRRDVLRTAGITAGAAAVGVGSTQLDPVSPVEESDALAVTTAALVGVAVGGAAGVAVANFTDNDPKQPDTSKSAALEDQVYNGVLTIATGREQFEQEMKNNFVNSSVGRSPYADAAWSEIRAAATEATVNGKTQTEAQQAAQTALDNQTTIAVSNHIKRWNTAVKALTPFHIQESENSPGVIEHQVGGSWGSAGLPPGTDVSNANTPSKWQNSSGDLAAFEYTGISLPGTYADIDGLSGDPNLMVMATRATNFVSPTASAANWGTKSKGFTYNSGSSSGNKTVDAIRATHSSFSTETVFKPKLYNDVLNRIATEYSNISSDLSTYVSNLHSGLAQGAIDPSKILSPTSIVDQFASDGRRSRLAGQLAASGLSVPTNAGWKATISHPDLSANSLQVDLFLRFSSGAVPLQSNMTLKSSEYDLAYIGYTNQASGNYETDILSGNSDLTISDITAVDDSSSDTTSTAGSSVNSDGSVTLGSGSNLPSEITNPSGTSTSHAVVVDTGTKTRYPVSVVTESSGTYKIPASETSYSGGESINSVKVVPVVETSSPVEYVSSPTNVDGTQAKNLLEAQKALVDKIDELDEAANSGGGGGGGVFGSGLPSLPGLSTAESAAVVILATLGLSALN